MGCSQDIGNTFWVGCLFGTEVVEAPLSSLEDCSRATDRVTFFVAGSGKLTQHHKGGRQRQMPPTPEAWQVLAPGERSEPGVKGTSKHGRKPWRGGRKTAGDSGEMGNHKLEAYATIWKHAPAC
ncbi:MAG: hypothetical protein ABIJ42_07585 [Acidobacteriota bacterium]